MEMNAVENIVQERRLLEEIQSNFTWYLPLDTVTCDTHFKTTRTFLW